MMLLLKHRRKRLLREIQRLQGEREKLLSERRRVVREIKKLVNNERPCNPVVVDFKDEPDEPFGWKRGTVRGIITLWVTLTTCLLALFRLIPLDWWLWIAGIVITSYFVSRISMNTRGF